MLANDSRPAARATRNIAASVAPSFAATPPAVVREEVGNRVSENVPAVPAELKPAVTRYIAPEALFWFRWAALGTVLAGFALMATRGHAYSAEALSFGFAAGYGPEDRGFTLLGVGIWLAIVMFLNVWGVIWPNQKRALGIVVVDDDKKAHAARVAMLGSRINLLLSLPMLTSMAMYQTLLG